MKATQYPYLKRNYTLRVSKGRKFYKEFRSGDCILLQDDAFAMLRFCDGQSTVQELTAAFAAAFQQSEACALALLKKYQDLLAFSTVPCRAPQLALLPPMLLGRSRPWPYGPLREETPFQLELSLTERCNHRCTYCYQGEEHTTTTSLPVADWLRVLEEAAALGVQEVVFTGGEPTLFPHFLDLVTAATSYGMFPRISTNGSFLDETLVDVLADAGAQYVHLSLPTVSQPLYGEITGVPGSLERVKRAVALLNARGFYIRVKMVLLPSNLHEVEALLTYCGNEGVDCVHLAPFIPSTRTPADQTRMPSEQGLRDVCNVADRLSLEYPEMLIAKPATHLWQWRNEKEITRCGGVKESLTILHNGNVTFCEPLGQVEAFLLGNVARDSLASIWNNPLPDRFSQPPIHQEPCKSCEHLLSCGSGCFLFSYMAQGDAFSVDPRCFRCAENTMFEGS